MKHLKTTSFTNHGYYPTFIFKILFQSQDAEWKEACSSKLMSAKGMENSTGQIDFSRKEESNIIISFD